MVLLQAWINYHLPKPSEVEHDFEPRPQKKDQVNQVKIFFSVALELGLVTLGPSVNDITQLQSRFFVGTFATVQLPRPGRGTVSTVRRAKGR